MNFNCRNIPAFYILQKEIAATIKMGLFDFLRKKQPAQTSSNLTLEQLLEKAAQEPAFRAEFYRKLLADELVVITSNSNLPEGSHTLQQDTSINIVSFDDKRIPVFTSTERIFDKGIITSQVEYIQMAGENLFKLVKGATFILNPYSEYGKELLPEEIERLLNGTVLSGSVHSISIERDTRVQIGQPEKWPSDIVNSLNILFSRRPSVKAAYLGLINYPESGEPPHYIFAIDVEDGADKISSEVGYTVQQFLGEKEFADVIKIDNKAGLSKYFLMQTMPFYQREEQ